MLLVNNIDLCGRIPLKGLLFFLFFVIINVYIYISCYCVDLSLWKVTYLLHLICIKVKWSIKFKIKRKYSTALYIHSCSMFGRNRSTAIVYPSAFIKCCTEEAEMHRNLFMYFGVRVPCGLFGTNGVALS